MIDIVVILTIKEQFVFLLLNIVYCIIIVIILYHIVSLLITYMWLIPMWRCDVEWSEKLFVTE